MGLVKAKKMLLIGLLIYFLIIVSCIILYLCISKNHSGDKGGTIQPKEKKRDSIKTDDLNLPFIYKFLGNETKKAEIFSENKQIFKKKEENGNKFEEINLLGDINLTESYFEDEDNKSEESIELFGYYEDIFH
ncbi:hypothetical protein TUBRATIS_18370 [Tubulinosema ratisbonensis]|uniref:Uncharacterized protein n=1 Tax=Tubulinosema ratisbonensis TaxID=291195 RepID=A0A437AKV2_9MICR|nr:hypothetical protein TUBRATIS_18370 [Tubulinosema ratisbonensis]